MTYPIRIVFAADHAGLELKEALARHVVLKSHQFIDLGPYNTDSVDYPDYAHELCEHLLKNSEDIGVLICGTGIGMSIAANRHKHIRCAVATSVEMASLTRQHNDANVLALGARIVSEADAIAILDTFLTTTFEGSGDVQSRHHRRLAKLAPVSDNQRAIFGQALSPHLLDWNIKDQGC